MADPEARRPGEPPAQPSIAVVHTLLCTQQGGGGLIVGVLNFCEALRCAGCGVQVCSVDWGKPFGGQMSSSYPHLAIRTAKGFLWPHPRLWFARGFRPMLERAAAAADVLHVNGLWLGIDNEGVRMACRKGIPCVVSPHGLLAPPALERARWKKAIVRWLRVDRNLRRVACMHATADSELAEIRAFGVTAPVAVVPYPVEVEPYRKADPQAARARCDLRWPEIRGKRVILFLSRIHPHKRPMDLVEAWGRLRARNPDWHLVIAGPDEVGYQAELASAVQASGAGADVSFVGPVYDADKVDLMAACDLFVLPTKSENFGLVVAEALASCKPAITTTGAPWRQLVDHGCGWWIPTGAGPLEEALAEALSLSDAERTRMGRIGRDLVTAKYSLPAVGLQMLELYQWLLGRGGKPSFVEED